MKNVTTHRAGKLCYVSFPGGGVEPTGASYDDFYLDNE